MDPLSSAYKQHIFNVDKADTSQASSLTSIESFSLPQKLPQLDGRDKGHILQMNKQCGKFLISAALAEEERGVPEKLPKECEDELMALYAQGVIGSIASHSKADFM